MDFGKFVDAMYDEEKCAELKQQMVQIEADYLKVQQQQQ